MAKNFRSVFRWLLPWWLTEGEGGLVAYSLATMKDIYLERVRQGLVARFPSYAADDALVEIGNDRGVKRGRDARDSYVTRLQQWRGKRGHLTRGGAFTALAQVAAYFGGIWTRSIDTKGNEHVHAADGTETYSYRQRWTWDPADAPTAAHDPAAGSDVASITLGQGSATITVHCDGFPGALIFLHLCSTSTGVSGTLGDTFAPPPGWTQLVAHGSYDAGSSTASHQEIWYLRVGNNAAPVTSVAIAYVNPGGTPNAHSVVGRAVNAVASSTFPDVPIFASGVAEGAGNGNFFPSVFHGGKSTTLFFAAGANTTYAFSGMYVPVTELDQERTFGNAGIAEAVAYVDTSDTHDLSLDAATVTLGASAALCTAWVTIVQQPPPKARFWLELRGIGAANAYSGTGGNLWTAPGTETVGLESLTPREASDLRDLFNVAPVWKPAGSRAEWAIINLTGALVAPQPSWQNWSEPERNGGVDTTQTPTRNPAFRYVSLYAKRTYAGRTDIFVTYVPMLDGTVYAGVNNVAAFAAQTLPVSKASYAGDPTNFPASVRLPDDGDSPT